MAATTTTSPASLTSNQNDNNSLMLQDTIRNQSTNADRLNCNNCILDNLDPSLLENARRNLGYGSSLDDYAKLLDPSNQDSHQALSSLFDCPAISQSRPSAYNIENTSLDRFVGGFFENDLVAGTQSPGFSSSPYARPSILSELQSIQHDPPLSLSSLDVQINSLTSQRQLGQQQSSSESNFVPHSNNFYSPLHRPLEYTPEHYVNLQRQHTASTVTSVPSSGTNTMSNSSVAQNTQLGHLLHSFGFLDSNFENNPATTLNTLPAFDLSSLEAFGALDLNQFNVHQNSNNNSTMINAISGNGIAQSQPLSTGTFDGRQFNLNSGTTAPYTPFQTQHALPGFEALPQIQHRQNPRLVSVPIALSQSTPDVLGGLGHAVSASSYPQQQSNSRQSVFRTPLNLSNQTSLDGNDVHRESEMGTAFNETSIPDQRCNPSTFTQRLNVPSSSAEGATPQSTVPTKNSPSPLLALSNPNTVDQDESGVTMQHSIRSNSNHEDNAGGGNQSSCGTSMSGSDSNSVAKPSQEQTQQPNLAVQFIQRSSRQRRPQHGGSTSVLGALFQRLFAIHSQANMDPSNSGKTQRKADAIGYAVNQLSTTELLQLLKNVIAFQYSRNCEDGSNRWNGNLDWQSNETSLSNGNLNNELANLDNESNAAARIFANDNLDVITEELSGISGISDRQFLRAVAVWCQQQSPLKNPLTSPSSSFSIFPNDSILSKHESSFSIPELAVNSESTASDSAMISYGTDTDSFDNIKSATNYVSDNSRKLNFHIEHKVPSADNISSVKSDTRANTILPRQLNTIPTTNPPILSYCCPSMTQFKSYNPQIFNSFDSPMHSSGAIQTTISSSHHSIMLNLPSMIHTIMLKIDTLQQALKAQAELQANTLSALLSTQIELGFYISNQSQEIQPEKSIEHSLVVSTNENSTQSSEFQSAETCFQSSASNSHILTSAVPQYSELGKPVLPSSDEYKEHEMNSSSFASSDEKKKNTISRKRQRPIDVEQSTILNVDDVVVEPPRKESKIEISGSDASTITHEFRGHSLEAQQQTRPEIHQDISDISSDKSFTAYSTVSIDLSDEYRYEHDSSAVFDSSLSLCSQSPSSEFSYTSQTKSPTTVPSIRFKSLLQQQNPLHKLEDPSPDPISTVLPSASDQGESNPSNEIIKMNQPKNGIQIINSIKHPSPIYETNETFINSAERTTNQIEGSENHLTEDNLRNSTSHEQCLLQLEALAATTPHWANHQNSYEWHYNRLTYDSSNEMTENYLQLFLDDFDRKFEAQHLTPSSANRAMSIISTQTIQFLSFQNSDGKSKESWELALPHLCEEIGPSSSLDKTDPSLSTKSQITLRFQQAVELIPLWISRLDSYRQSHDQLFNPLSALLPHLQTTAFYQFFSSYVEASTRQLKILETELDKYMNAAVEDQLHSIGTQRHQLQNTPWSSQQGLTFDMIGTPLRVAQSNCCPSVISSSFPSRRLSISDGQRPMPFNIDPPILNHSVIGTRCPGFSLPSDSMPDLHSRPVPMRPSTSSRTTASSCSPPPVRRMMMMVCTAKPTASATLSTVPKTASRKEENISNSSNASSGESTPSNPSSITTTPSTLNDSSLILSCSESEVESTTIDVTNSLTVSETVTPLQCFSKIKHQTLNQDNLPDEALTNSKLGNVSKGHGNFLVLQGTQQNNELNNQPLNHPTTSLQSIPVSILPQSSPHHDFIVPSTSQSRVIAPSIPHFNHDNKSLLQSCSIVSDRQSTSSSSNSSTLNPPTNCQRGGRSSGVQGVVWKPEEDTWIAFWQDPTTSQQQIRRFPVSQFGADNARKMAMKCRREADKQLTAAVMIANHGNGSGKVGDSNSTPQLPRSDVPGVYWYRNRNGWVAQWFESGKNKHKFFAASVFGVEGAKQKAIAYRLMKLEEKKLKGCSNPLKKKQKFNVSDESTLKAFLATLDYQLLLLSLFNEALNDELANAK